MYQYGSVRAQQNNIEKGKLRVSVRGEDGQPIENAQVQISYTGEPDSIIEEIRTDSSGFTPELELAAPPLEYSMSPVEDQPYAEYTVKIQADGYEPEEIAGTEFYDGILLPLPADFDISEINKILLKIKEEKKNPDWESFSSLLSSYLDLQLPLEGKPIRLLLMDIHKCTSAELGANH